MVSRQDLQRDCQPVDCLSDEQKLLLRSILGVVAGQDREGDGSRQMGVASAMSTRKS
jgi:hypothetical protein